MRRRVALIGGDSDTAAEFGSFLEEARVTVAQVRAPNDVAAALRREGYDAVFVAAGLTAADTRRVVSDVAAACPEVPVVVMAADADLTAALALLRAGVSDTLRVPFTREEALFSVRKALLVADHADEQAAAASANVNLDTQSPEMKQALGLADRAARSMTTVLIRGESGVGKEVFARRIHERSSRASGPFIKVQSPSRPRAASGNSP